MNWWSTKVLTSTAKPLTLEDFRREWERPFQEKPYVEIVSPQEYDRRVRELLK